jgi:predicted TIM-barrel fold metal-dependent hydrolase
VEEKMRRIRSEGFLGVKIHPDYQETFINDDAYVRILTLAREYDLIVVAHSGVDYGYLDCPVRCTPERVLDLLRKAPHSKLVLAHMGANEMSEQAYDLLCGEDVYFDTAYVLRFTDRETFQKMIKKHGEDRILFATDSPWSDIKTDVSILRSYQLGAATEQKIFYENAMRLLKG